MEGVNQRLALVALVGVLVVAGAAGVALELGRSHASGEAQRRAAATQRATLAAVLIDSLLTGAADATGPSDGPVTRARVTPGEILAVRRSAPLAAVFGPHEALLGSRPAIARSTERLIARQPALVAALADGHQHVSDLLPAAIGAPRGFIDVAPFPTSWGRRATVRWLPLTQVTGTLSRDLAQVADDAGHRTATQLVLLDGHGTVIGSSPPRSRGRLLDDAALRAAPSARPGETRSRSKGGRFVAAAGLHVAPWTVVDTTDAPAGGPTWTWGLILLTALLAVAGACLALLGGLLAGTGKLARANASLGRRNDEVERATEAKSRFVASMAHELRSPLTAVMGFSELMHEARAGPLTQTQREYLGIVRSSSDHLLALINEALDLATVEAGELRLSPEPIDPCVVARECVSALRPLAQARGVRIRVAAPHLGIVSLDPSRLRQVILNFVSNAVKFSPPNGRVTVRLARAGAALTIAVSDEGAGISLADQSRVFDEFVQLGERRRDGSGLGLAVTRRIVQAQGGAVAVSSRPGAGATFTARLPWVDGVSGEEEWRLIVAQIAPEAGDAPSPRRRGRRAAARASRRAGAPAGRP